MCKFCRLNFVPKIISKSVKCVMCLVQEVITMHALSPLQSKHMFIPVLCGIQMMCMFTKCCVSCCQLPTVYLHACTATVT